jgi:hypothetical protein
VGTVFPVDALQLDQAKEEFVDQSGGVEIAAAMFTGYVRAGHVSQVVIHKRSQFCVNFSVGLRTALAPLTEEICYVSGH